MRTLALLLLSALVVPLDSLGTVYPTMHVGDAWGVLEVSGGALLAADWTAVAVPVAVDTTARPLQGDGWTLTLKPGWHVVPGGRAGDQALRRER